MSFSFSIHIHVANGYVKLAHKQGREQIVRTKPIHHHQLLPCQRQPSYACKEQGRQGHMPQYQSHGMGQHGKGRYHQAEQRTVVVHIEIFRRIGFVERCAVPCVPKHIFEDEEIVAFVHLGQCRHHRQQQPQAQQRAWVAEKRMPEKSSCGCCRPVHAIHHLNMCVNINHTMPTVILKMSTTFSTASFVVHTMQGKILQLAFASKV